MNAPITYYQYKDLKDFCYINLNACQCPLSGLSIAECDKYDIVFKGRVKNVVECDNKF
jgi:hypothetical protein